MIFNFKDIPVFYSDEGQGKTILLLHGFLENSSMWNDLAPELSKKHRVITMDLLGHGQTGCLGYIHSMELMAEVVESVLNHLKIETFTITFDDLTSSSVMLGMLWESVYVGVKIEVPTDDIVLANINDVMNGTPTSNDYYSAAIYYLEEGKDTNQAKSWVDKAIEMAGDKVGFWQLRKQSLIYAKAGDKNGAIAIAKKALAAAEKAGNADYIKMNKDSLKEWGAMVD